MLSLQFSPTMPDGLLGMHARLNSVQAEAMQGFTPLGHVQSLTQQVSPTPHWNGSAAHDGVTSGVDEQPILPRTTAENEK